MNVDVSDGRRAGALLAHVAAGDAPAVRAMIAEARAEGRLEQLLLAFVALLRDALPGLRGSQYAARYGRAVAALGAERELRSRMYDEEAE